jgi:hypothetical protein
MVATTSKTLFPMLLFLIAAAAFFLYQSWSSAAVAGRQQTAAGRIITHDIENHDTYSYHYAVGPNSYAGRDGAPGKPLNVGDTVTVFYDPKNPGRSGLVSFWTTSEGAKAPLPMILAAAALIAFLSIRRGDWRRLRR